MARYFDRLGVEPTPAQKRRWWRIILRRLPSFTFSLLVAVLAITVLWRFMVITVPAGHVGVLWKRLNTFDFYCWCFGGRGTMVNPQQLRGEGLHILLPWDRLYIYNLRLQSTAQTYNAITRDGVNVTVQINIRFQLLNNAVGVLHKFIGPDYLNSVVSPEIGSQTRQVISQYTAQEVYVSRDAIQEKVREAARRGLGANLNRLVQPEAMEQPDPKGYNDALQYSIQVLDTLVLSLELPPAIVAAINRQTEQFYLIQEYRYRVEREAQESRRKQIEANGIAAFQQTVSQGISESYLRWRGIEATLMLAQSPNSKVVVIGGKDGLPIILGNVDSPAIPTPPRNGAEAPPVSDSAASTLTAAPSSQTTVVVQPGAVQVHAPPGGPPAGDSAPATEKMPAAASPSPSAKPDKPATFNPFSLSDYESVFSRITRGPRWTETPPAPEAP
jgi:prohibitin 2